jgi:hypothetical protein
MSIPEALWQNRTDTESFSGIATAFAVLPHPKQGAPCRASDLFIGRPKPSRAG